MLETVVLFLPVLLKVPITDLTTVLKDGIEVTARRQREEKQKHTGLLSIETHASEKVTVSLDHSNSPSHFLNSIHL